MRELMIVGCTLGKLIRLAREEKGWPRTKLAEFAGISPNTMVKYEKAGEEGGQYPSSENLKKICELLEIDPRNAFDAIGYESSGSTDPFVERFSFTDHFRTGMDWLNWKHSVKSIDDLNSAFDNVFGELHYVSQRLGRIEAALKTNGSGDVGDVPSRPVNSDDIEAVGAASTSNPQQKNRSD